VFTTSRGIIAQSGYYRAKELVGKSVPIETLGRVLNEANELLVRQSTQKGHPVVDRASFIPDFPKTLRNRLSIIIENLESAFNGDNEDENILMEKGRVRIIEWLD
jgi:hypothetical protein